MAQFKTLHDLYRFPGCVPLSHVYGIFGDPMAVVISLRRRRKKRLAVFVVAPILVTTTKDLGVSAISPVGTNASTSSLLCVVSSALSVAA